jgi:hypothetical protein
MDLTKDKLINIMTKLIVEWKTVREKKKLYIHFPKRKYGMENYLYYYFQDLLPPHEIIKDKLLNKKKYGESELLIMTDIILVDDVESYSYISFETVTIMTVVILNEFIETFKYYHFNQDLKILYEYSVLNPNEVVINYISNHENLRYDCLNIYDDINSLEPSIELNLKRTLSKALPLYVKNKGISFCSYNNHILEIIFKDNPWDVDYIFDINNVEIKLDFMDKLKEDLEGECSIIFISILIKEVGIFNAHANMCIINKYDRTFEIFDPQGVHGQTSRNTICVDKIIATILSDYLVNYTHIPLNNYCYIGPQDKYIQYFDKDFGGICNIMSILYAILRALNPDFTRSEIVEEINHMVTYPDFGITIRKLNRLLENLIESDSNS